MYAVMFLTIIIGFITSRLIITRLGVEDFGIYSLIGGLVILFTFINGSMSGSIQRFLSAELGHENHEAVTEYFNASIIVHIGIALIVVLAGKTIGEWVLLNKLSIPEARVNAAYWVYHTTLIAFVFQILSTPAQAMLTTYERMGSLALFTFITPFSRFISILILGYIACMDKLITYSAIIMLFAIIQFALYYWYTLLKCPDARLIKCKDKAKYSELTSFAGWGLFGDLAAVARLQGASLVLNIFFGTTANAAYGISGQLVNNFNNLSTMVTRAANPQIIKKFVSGKKEDAFKLVTQLSKISFSVLLVVTIPFILQTEFILTLWLKEVPLYTVSFVRLAIGVALIEISSMPLITLSKATGKIMLYQSVVGGILLISLPIAYLAYKCEVSANGIFYVFAITAVIAFIARLLILKSTAGLPIVKFFTETFLKAVVLSSVVLVIGFTSGYFIDSTLLSGQIFQIVVLPIITAVVAGFVILTRVERMTLLKMVTRQ